MSVIQKLSNSNTTFQKNLALGQAAESKIAKWFIRRPGTVVMPVYDIEYETGKGPRVFMATTQVAAPDLLVFLDGTKTIWCEAKQKTTFTWHRKSGKWTTGIDLNHWEHYREVERSTPFPVWLLFLHESSTPAKQDAPFCPGPCPVGLFGNKLAVLENCISHKHDGHGRHGMVYWAYENLKLIAPLEEVIE